MDEKVKDLLV